MPCPYFYPQLPAGPCGQHPPARMPLGRLYEGECHADPLQPTVPDRKVVRDCCNFGYGHGHCAIFPKDSEADAVRFSLSATRELVWILEKDFSPVRHGRMQDASPILRKQAEVFLENYERFIKRTSGPRIDF